MSCMSFEAVTWHRYYPLNLFAHLHNPCFYDLHRVFSHLQFIAAILVISSLRIRCLCSIQLYCQSLGQSKYRQADILLDAMHQCQAVLGTFNALSHSMLLSMNWVLLLFPKNLIILQIQLNQSSIEILQITSYPVPRPVWHKGGLQ